ncbi:DUF1488 family protein [Falsiroseomonas tokyonensis]|uniref:DUF1488 family protein n=1 Tax=Falsiroseomonas tokyonensis TaxID=430521 RepID=A0ABV7BP46_9PROT|nr:DUF1488 family protein [Falsiroseomonas tokyonensis]MBU8537314.1 DUF1488 family protein [Falsiroseomonas tokyonensis]
MPATPSTPAPRWDGRRVLFEVVDADQLVPCAISMNALQDISEIRRFKPADLMQCFAALRPRIEAIALDKHRARSGAAAGLLHIWTEDIEDAAPAAPPPAPPA